MICFNCKSLLFVRAGQRKGLVLKIFLLGGFLYNFNLEFVQKNDFSENGPVVLTPCQNDAIINNDMMSE